MYVFMRQSSLWCGHTGQGRNEAVSAIYPMYEGKYELNIGEGCELSDGFNFFVADGDPAFANDTSRCLIFKLSEIAEGAFLELHFQVCHLQFPYKLFQVLRMRGGIIRKDDDIIDIE